LRFRGGVDGDGALLYNNIECAWKIFGNQSNNQMDNIICIAVTGNYSHGSCDKYQV